MRILARSFLHCCAALPLALAASPARVDFNYPGRSDAIAPETVGWEMVAGSQMQREIEGVTVIVRSHDGQLQPSWWKGSAIDGARLVADGITTGSGVGIELRLRGLTPGRHSIVTYHNWTEPSQPEGLSPIVIRASSGQEATVTPTYRVGNDWDAAVGYITFEASSSGEATLEFTSKDSDGAVILCGFRLDVPDPRRQASHPSPEDLDEHAPADEGLVNLRWRAPRGTKQHRIYIGSTEAAVASATSDAPEYRGSIDDTTFPLHVGRATGDFFWRIDTVDTQDAVTPGEVWRFRARRLAFPGAEGYGRFASGGRGGRILHVTTLADSGPGSLRAAVEAEGARTVIFDVGGLITLQSRLSVRNPYLTVAGQTAPGKGITIRGYNFGLLGTHDVIIRHVRVRPGNIAGVTLDGMGMASSDHSIIDHASISWTIDEAFSSRGARNITLQRTLISEALNVAGHKKYRPGTQHGYAASISGMIGSFHHNLLAHNSGRNWSLAGGLDGRTRHTGWLDIRNNVVYNWHNRTTDGGAAKVNYVNNYYAPGPASKVFHLLKPERNNIAGFGPQDYFVSGNIMEGHVGADDPLGGVIFPPSGGDFIVEKPFFESHVTTHSARAAYKQVLSDVGCTQPMLDEHDRRVIQETLDRSFTYRGSKSGLPGLPDSQDDVGGWEDYPEVRHEAGWDTDRDGLPGWWERIHGMDSNSSTGGEHDADADGDGYTNLEEYLHWMAEPHRITRAGAELTIDLGHYTRGYTDRPVHRVDETVGGEAELLKDGRTLRFRSASGGLGRVRFTVRDAEGDSMTRKIGIAILSPEAQSNR